MAASFGRYTGRKKIMAICVTCQQNFRGTWPNEDSCKKGVTLPSGLVYCKKCINSEGFEWGDIEYLRSQGFWYPAHYEINHTLRKILEVYRKKNG